MVAALYEKQRERLGYETLWDFDEDVSFAGDGPKTRGAVEELFDGVFGELSPRAASTQELRRCRVL